MDISHIRKIQQVVKLEKISVCLNNTDTEMSKTIKYIH
uniref:Uncharacterized protein n=1 Tax=Arundo donax TaxID=35708 RepID=A0A0A9H042_ARUDO